MSQHEKINYIEFPSRDIGITKEFFSKAFGWEFVDYGPDYVSVTNAGIDGGFYKSEQVCSYNEGSTLAVLFSTELEKTQTKIEKAGGKIIVPIFEFPGGRRFHFTDTNGNEYAVWAE